MSNNKKESNDANEEVDLIVFFNLIGRALKKVVEFLIAILKAAFSVIIYTLKVIVNSWKIIVAVVIIAFVLGYALERTRPITYSSEMLVEPYFDSKYQLVTNIKYFNALIASKDHEALDEIFNSDSSTLDVKDLKGFKVEPGPETENDKILQYQNFSRRLDSVRKEDVDFEQYIENRSIYSGNLFLITAYSNKRDIFKKLEGGVLSAFTNQFSEEEFTKKEQLREVQKQNLLTQLQEIDSLKTFYLRVREQESKKNSKQLSLGSIPLSSDSKSTTREFELLEKENEIRDELNALEEQKIEQDKVFDVISSFQRVGNQNITIYDRYSLIFPAIGFVLLCIFYLIKRVVIYVKNYEE